MKYLGVARRLIERTRLVWGERRNRGKRDAIAAECDAEFLALGGSIVRLDCVGDDVPDLILGVGGRNEWVEYKTGTKKLSPGQVAFARLWRGGPVWEVRSREDARRVLLGVRAGTL